jgi:hypothetical protein
MSMAWSRCSAIASGVNSLVLARHPGASARIVRATVRRRRRHLVQLALSELR